MINRNTDPVYNFFCIQIDRAAYDIRNTKMKINNLAKEQTAFKRGMAHLVDLRRKYVEEKYPKLKKKKAAVALSHNNGSTPSAKPDGAHA